MTAGREAARAGWPSWTGGQYSLFRALLGAYLAVHFAALVPWAAELFSSEGALAPGRLSPYLSLFPNVFALVDAPFFVTGACAVAAVAALLLALGWRDRWAALLLWYLWACFFGRNPLIANPGLPYVGLLLVAHAMMPRAPFGSLEASGRVDPAGPWRLRKDVWSALWILMAVGYSYSGFTKLASPSWVDGTAVARVLANPLARPGLLNRLVLELPDELLRLATWGALGLELLFVPFALVRRTRPWIWCALLAMHLGLVALIDFADLSMGMVLLHLFTFDPAWLPPLRSAAERGPETFYYDGDCGLCHRAVRFVLAEDAAEVGGTLQPAFRFAPLQSEAFERATTPDQRASLPDSIVVVTHGGELLARSGAFVHVLKALGGAWRALGTLLAWIPRPLRDLGYDGIARIRKRLFVQPKDACPMLPPHLRERFDG